MLKKSFLLLSAVLLMQSCASSYQKLESKSETVQKKVLDEKTVALPNFKEVEVSQAIRLKLIPSDTRRAVIRSTHLKDVIVKVEEDDLILKYALNTVNDSHYTEVVLYTPDIQEISASSLAQVEIQKGFSPKEWGVELSSAARLKGYLQAEKIEIEASSASYAEVQIKGKKVEIEATSAAEVRAGGICEEVDAEVTSFAKVYADKLKYKKATRKINSGGVLRLR